MGKNFSPVERILNAEAGKMILQIKYGCESSLTEKVTFESRCEDGQGVILTAIGEGPSPAGAAASATSLVQKRWGGHCGWRRGNTAERVRKSDPGKPRAGQIIKF